MKQIPLTQDKYALVDDEDFEYLNQWKWFALKYKYTWYAVRNEFVDKNKYKTTRMHRQIMQAKKDEKIDHKDNNGLNNQKFNLREATKSQNASNRTKPENNTSGYKGVHFRKNIKKKPWEAYICVNYKRRHLGYYATAVEAAIAYDQAAKLYHGEFAKLNFPEGV